MAKIILTFAADAPFDQVEYDPADPASYVGAGALGRILKGTGQAHGQPIALVIKEPLDPARTDSIHDEYAILDRLMPLTPFTPRAAIGHAGANPVLVMPFYDPANLLVTRVRAAWQAGDDLDAELQAVQTGQAFANAMAALERTGETCVDRKIEDFYWFSPTDAVVIDWNVRTPATPDTLTGSVALFGYLWYELFLQRKGRAPYAPFNDRLWLPVGTFEDLSDEDDLSRAQLAMGAISLGLRLLLARCVTRDPGLMEANGGFTYRVIETHLRDWQTVLTAARTGSPLPQAAVIAVIGTDDAATIAAVETDLAVRRLPRAERSLDQIKARRAALGKVQQATTGLRGLAPGEVSDGLNIDRAATIAELERWAALLAHDNDWISWAHQYRWLHLCRLVDQAVAANPGRGRLRDFQTNVVTIGEELHSLTEADRLDTLDDLTRRCGEIRQEFSRFATSSPAALAFLRELTVEVRLRRLATEARLTPDFSDRAALTADMAALIAQHPDHYLDGLSTAPEAARVDRTLWRTLYRADVLRKVGMAVSTLTADSAPAAVFEAYALAQISARSGLEHDWIALASAPLLELAELIQFAQQHPTVYAAILDRGVRLRAADPRLDGSTGVTPADYQAVIDRVLSATAERLWTPIRAVLAQRPIGLAGLRQAVQDYEILYPHYSVLHAIGAWDGTAAAGVSACSTALHRLTRALSTFTQRADRTAITELLTALQDAEALHMDTAAYLAQLQEAHDLLAALQTGALDRIRALQQEIAGLPAQLAPVQQQYQTALSGLHTSLHTNTAAIDQQQAQTISAVKRLRVETRSRDLIAAVRRFDLPAATENYNALLADDTLTAPEKTELTGWFNQLQTLATQYPNNLTNFQALQNSLRAGQPAGEKWDAFFGQKTVLELAKTNPLLADLLDLYWDQRLRRQTGTVEGKFAIGIGTATSEVQVQIRERTQQVASQFIAGRINDATAALDSLPINQLDPVTTALVAHLRQTWRTRQTHYALLLKHFDGLEQRLGPAGTAPAVEQLVELVESAAQAVMACPVDACSPALLPRWDALIAKLTAAVPPKHAARFTQWRERTRAAIAARTEACKAVLTSSVS